MKKMLLMGLLCCVLTSCEKENHLFNEDQDELISSQDSIEDRFIPQWITIIDDSKDDGELDISSRYLGIQGWPCFAHPPRVYVGGAFPKTTFATTFEREVTGAKHPVCLTFGFTEPYIVDMDTITHFIYKKKLKEALESKEFFNHKYSMRPYKVEIAEFKNLKDLDLFFVDNSMFGKTLEEIGRQKFSLKGVKSLCIGKVLFKGFTVSMDFPVNGLFVNKRLNSEENVYVKSLTYGVCAYFIIASELSFQEVLTVLTKPIVYDYHEKNRILQRSQIILLTVSDISQNANIMNTFDDLNSFLKNPFMNGNLYGYPILCKGIYVNDNDLFVK